MGFKARHLIGGNVTFGRSKVDKAKEPFKQSLHYLWWEYLRRSTRYKETCKNGGKGELRELYKDFGDVFTVDFKTWWQIDNRGIELFAEELPDDKIRRVNKAEDLNLKDEILTVSIPLNLPQEFILETVRKMLKKAGHQGEKGVKTNKESTARYKIVGGVNKSGLRNSLKLWDLKQQKPELKNYQLAIECKVGNFWKFLDGKDELMDKEQRYLERALLSSIANRHLRKVERIIKSVEEGKFPNVKIEKVEIEK
jgi:hypothetical protein